MKDIAALARRLEVLEAEAAVRRLMARYMQLCDTPSTDETLAGLGELFVNEAIWAGRGAHYEAEFGEQHGKAAILAAFRQFLEPQPHYRLNAHYLASESIIVEGASATGTWMLLQAATRADGTSELRSARLRVQFIDEAGTWKIARFETTRLFRRDVAGWDS